ncbi:NUDIX hydrolase [Salinibacter sp.]|uniref:NUDIX hydrolase n=1 Tax=Salinibacter sp. TaxID=2065818 RepID=UPI0021E9628D|nr:NUDIX domain-containing protein [Salinibacter sp.]
MSDNESSNNLSIRPGVAGVVLNAREEVLLHYRSAENGWAPPSGSMEPGEDVKSALKRELREETRLEVSIERFEGLYSDPRFQVVRPKGEAPIHFVPALFTCRVSAGELRGSSEGAAWEWFDAGSLPDRLLAYAQRWLNGVLEDGSTPVVQ